MKKTVSQIIKEEVTNMFTGNDWAVFHVSKGYGKCFVVALSDVTKNGVKSCDYRAKYSDPSVLKFSIEQALEIVKTSVHAGDRDVWGIVNSRGVQKTFDWRIKFPDNYDWDGNEITETYPDFMTGKPKFVIPVGISGSGKSTWIKSLEGKGFEVVSPDEIRRELTGSISDQSRNKDVFPIAFQRTIDYLNNGTSVIFDATNVGSYHRKQMLNYLRDNVSADFDAYAKVFDVDPEVSKQRVAADIEAGVDRSNVPPEAIDRQYGNFTRDLDKLEDDGYTIIN